MYRTSSCWIATDKSPRDSVRHTRRDSVSFAGKNAAVVTKGRFTSEWFMVFTFGKTQFILLFYFKLSSQSSRRSRQGVLCLVGHGHATIRRLLDRTGMLFVCEATRRERLSCIASGIFNDN